MPPPRTYTVAQVIAILEEEDQLADGSNIFITPSECAELTDEDSGDEGQPGFADNLSGNQL